MTKELVISAYQRDYSWIGYLNPEIKVTIYRKGENKNSDREIFIEKNIGQDVHTFFYHLAKNYYNLSDYTLVSQDFPFDHVGNYIEIINASPAYWDAICKLKIEEYWAFSTATALNWQHPMPKEAYTGKTLICKEDGSPHHRPPELNIKTLWPQIFQSDCPESFEFVPSGHFCISKNQVHKKTIDFYQNIVTILESDRKFTPYEIERLESYIFNPEIK
jgi:hypothetical protein